MSQGKSSRPPPPASIWPGKVECVQDIEENIWSPRLGMKGKIDLTVDIDMDQLDLKVNRNNEDLDK